MADNSSHPMSSGMTFYIVTACAEYAVGLPVNLWALGLIVSSKSSTIETEILTLNLLWSETLCSVFFFVWLVQDVTRVPFAVSLINFYQGMRSAGRALFQWHLCMDRYLAVVHPVVFLRYKHIRYRGACLVPLWIIVIACGLCNVFFTLDPVMISIFGLSLLVPTLSTEVLFSLIIVLILRKSGPGERRQGDAVKRRAVRIITFLAVMVVVNNITFILFPAFDPKSYEHLFPAALALSTVGSSVHGFLYLSRVKKLQITFLCPKVSAQSIKSNSNL